MTNSKKWGLWCTLPKGYGWMYDGNGSEPITFTSKSEAERVAKKYDFRDAPCEARPFDPDEFQSIWEEFEPYVRTYYDMSKSIELASSSIRLAFLATVTMLRASKIFYVTAWRMRRALWDAFTNG